MSVAYLPPVSNSHANVGDSLLREAHTSGPAYARSRIATRWHMIRSAVSWIPSWTDDADLRTTYYYWCGQFAFGDRAMIRDALPAKEPLCGTCYGRSRGADPDDSDLLFSPRGLIPPKICPGTRTMWCDETAWNRGNCLVCGEHVKIGASGGPYNSHWGMRSHAPGPALINGCEFHGWKQLALTIDRRVACRCKCVEVAR